MVMKPYLIASHIILLTQAFNMSIFNRKLLKTCHGKRMSLSCPENDVLWVHEAFVGFDPLSLSISSDNFYVCNVDDKDCRNTLADTEPVFRATSIKPHYAEKVTGKIRCLNSMIVVGITYKLIHYSCIQQGLLSPIYMFRSMTRVTNIAHIQLPSLPEDDSVEGGEIMCRIHASAGHVFKMTSTVLYIDLPRASPCSQRFWANDQDDIELVSFCSPVWLRQRTLYQGSVKEVALHFKSTPSSASTVKQAADDTQSEPSLFLWIYIQAEKSFTVTCGQHPGMSTLGPTRPVTPATDHNRLEPSSSSPTHSTSPASTYTTHEPFSSTVHQLGTSAPLRHGGPTSAEPPPVTNRTAYHSTVQITKHTTEMPLINISQSIAGQENSPETALPNVDAAIPAPRKWETVSICMGVVIVAILFFGGVISVRRWRNARRLAMLQREEEMPYDPPLFHTHLPDHVERHQSQYLTVNAADPSWQEEPHLDQQGPGIDDHEFLGMTSSNPGNHDTLFTPTEPTYASIPM